MRKTGARVIFYFSKIGYFLIALFFSTALNSYLIGEILPRLRGRLSRKTMKSLW